MRRAGASLVLIDVARFSRSIARRGPASRPCRTAAKQRAAINRRAVCVDRDAQCGRHLPESSAIGEHILPFEHYVWSESGLASPPGAP